MQSQDTQIATERQQMPCLVEYLARTPEARDGLQVTLITGERIDGKLRLAFRDGFTIRTVENGAVHIMTAAVATIRIIPVPA